MNTLRIIALGLAAVTAAVTLASVQIWRDRERKARFMKVLRGMTPETLIANCGQPTSDTDLTTPSGWALTRAITYRTPEYPWVKLEFTRDPWSPWRLSHFSSPTVGVSSADENAYIAIPEFPCMANSRLTLQPLSGKNQ